MDVTARIIARAEAERRKDLLGLLRNALGSRRIDSVLIGRHVLELHASAPWAPPGLADPQLYVFTASGPDIVTTDGQDYRFASGRRHPATDPIGAADLLDWQA